LNFHHHEPTETLLHIFQEININQNETRTAIILHTCNKGEAATAAECVLDISIRASIVALNLKFVKVCTLPTPILLKCPI
jgi:hypothetical protein